MAESALLGRSLAELTDWVKAQGQPGYRGQQLYQWLYERGARSFSEISVFPKTWREELVAREQVVTGADPAARLAVSPSDTPADRPVGGLIGRSRLYHRSEARDRTVKYLLELSDGNIIETVGIPTASRLTVCVSSQVGCPMACDFCATGKGGFTRNLSTAEIVDQVLTVQEDFDRRVSNVVFMGMGEPLLNLDAVLGATRSLNRDLGIGQRNLTVSSVGIPGTIARLAQHQLQATLAISLHASNQATRERLVPSAKHYPIDAILDDCRDYVQHTGRRVTFEYILLAGVNDSPDCAAELAQWLRGFQSHVNLIPYNPIDEVDYRRPSPDRIKAFVETLEERYIATSVRRTRGLEADAACGQLRASSLRL